MHKSWWVGLILGELSWGVQVTTIFGGWIAHYYADYVSNQGKKVMHKFPCIPLWVIIFDQVQSKHFHTYISDQEKMHTYFMCVEPNESNSRPSA